MKVNRKLTGLVGLVAAAGLGTGIAKADLYDDFSGMSLDISKWSIFNQPGTVSLAYLVNNNAFNLNTPMTSAASIILQPTRTFSAGDTFEFSLDYNSGSPNAYQFLEIDGGSATSLVGENAAFTTTPFGSYTETVNFGMNSANVTIAGPINYSKTIDYNGGSPNTIGIGVYAGDNAAIDMDFRDVNCTPEPSTIGLLGLGAVGAGMLARKRNSKNK